MWSQPASLPGGRLRTKFPTIRTGLCYRNLRPIHSQGICSTAPWTWLQGLGMSCLECKANSSSRSCNGTAAPLAPHRTKTYFWCVLKKGGKKRLLKSCGPNVFLWGIPGSRPNEGCFFIASINASKSLGFLKVHALRLMSMLRLGLMGIGVVDI